MSNTIDQKEVEKFSKIADEWWDYSGKFKPLHKFNPIRISLIREKIVSHFKKDQKSLTAFEGLEIIDIGCGGGLISEPICRMGAKLTAIDASKKNIEVAKIHAQKNGLEINYLCSSAEEIVKENKKFDIVLALEIIEHVSDVEAFISACANLVKENGLVFIATLNRTIKSLAFAKFAAEYVLKLLPVGTHDWKKFLKPSEINKFAEKHQLILHEINGFKYSFFSDSWIVDKEDIDINYIIIFEKKND
jgi:2-polyprenyl-6-hydroxyphenyl methylase/3-demethylubiquinone-9 3-methyltransferase